MAQGGFGWFVIGCAVGAAVVYFGPTAYQRYVQKVPVGGVRVEVASDYTPGVWRRTARFDVEFSRLKANGQNWDWPMTDPELQLCIREGTEYRKCFGPLDPELAGCQAKFRCTTGPIRVPDVPFAVELNEWDDYNKPDPIGSVECEVGQVCKFPLGMVTVHNAGPVAAPQQPNVTQAGATTP
jgi:hypothetical protein